MDRKENGKFRKSEQLSAREWNKRGLVFDHYKKYKQAKWCFKKQQS